MGVIGLLNLWIFLTKVVCSEKMSPLQHRNLSWHRTEACRMFGKDQPEERWKESCRKATGETKRARGSVLCVHGTMTAGAHSPNAAWLSEATPSHWCEISRVTSWFLSAEVDFIWHTNSGMTGLFPWERVLSLVRSASLGVGGESPMTTAVLEARWITFMKIQNSTRSRVQNSFLLF